MIRPPARIALLTAAALALGAPLAAPLAAQQTFELPPASPSPTPAPAGPADERAGVAIPPRSLPEPTATPVIQPLPSPSPAASQPPLTLPAQTPTPRRTPAPAGTATAPAAQDASPVATPAPDVLNGPLALPTAAPQVAPAPVPQQSTSGDNTIPVQWSQWWPFAAVGLGALALLGAGAALWRRRKPKTLRLAAPVAGAPAAAPAVQEPPRLDLTLEITAATRSVMMFTLHYRLTIANRSDRAVNDVNAAARLACARGGAGGAAGAAQGLEHIDRIGPHQARSVTGTVQLPLASIAPLRQGQTPLFIPLVHVILEGEGLPADTKTFVVGPKSASGRVHPISLDQPPGSIAGLVAQAVAIPASAAA